MENSETNTVGASVPAIHLSEIEGVPVARDTDVAERLGFDRPRDIRKLIERNLAEIEGFGICATVAQNHGGGRGRPATEYWLNEEQALLVSVLSNAPNAPAVRAMLIKTFVAWRRGHLAPVEFDGTVTEISPAVRSAIGGIVKSIVHGEVAASAREIAEALSPDMLFAVLARHNMMVRRGKTAGQIYKEAGFPPIKGIAGWLGNRLAALGFSIADQGRAEMGNSTARLFDPDKVSVWLRAGGRLAIEQKIAERRGQGTLRLVLASA